MCDQQACKDQWCHNQHHRLGEGRRVGAFRVIFCQSTNVRYDCVVKVAEIFEPNVVIVLDHERLFNDLKRDLPTFVHVSRRCSHLVGSTNVVLQVLHQPKSGGVESRSGELKIASRQRSVHQVRTSWFHFPVEILFSTTTGRVSIRTFRIPSRSPTTKRRTRTASRSRKSVQRSCLTRVCLSEWKSPITGQWFVAIGKSQLQDIFRLSRCQWNSR